MITPTVQRLKQLTPLTDEAAADAGVWRGLAQQAVSQLYDQGFEPVGEPTAELITAPPDCHWWINPDTGEQLEGYRQALLITVPCVERDERS